MSSLASFAAEYRAATEGCGLVDRSERGKLALTGSEAKSFLQGQVSNDVEALTPGTGCYAAFLTPKGKMLGDVRILDTGEEALLDTERVALQELFNMVRRFSIGYELELHKRTLERGLLSLIGPTSTTIARAVDLGDAEHANAPVSIDGIEARAIRTDLGIDLLCDASDTAALTAALQARGAELTSKAVAECVRVECGRPRYGVDLDDSVIPQEADLNQRAVSFAKGCYVGQETVARLFYRGKPNRRLQGLRLSAPAATGAEIRFGDRVVGHLGSVAESPSRGWIALALVRREAPAGSDVSVGGDAVAATVVELPFAG
ncbi:MAG TPA: glycine cleavage T C-terminal barrel domain-containing protein [Solirubrobacteraceae bacterium]|jgi:folate-binding protein YgfZ|nr:glycine cleavage T C-terminal barrel domain-containing protein [Solirubrobacteraceae bacterium]